MDIRDLGDRVEEVSQTYARRFGIARDADWFLLKLHEEMGELTQAHLMLTGQGRSRGRTPEEIRQSFRAEVADVLSHLLLLARHHEIDVVAEVRRKWFAWLPGPADPGEDARVDPVALLPPLYEDLGFLSPLSPARADELAAFVAGAGNGGNRDDGGAGGLVREVGCGWGELLLRVLSAGPGLHGVGVDRNERYVAHARHLAAARSLAPRAEFVAADASAFPQGPADAVMCLGASQIWGTGGAHVDYASALRNLRAMVGPGGRVLYGEGIWSTAPTEPALAALGARTQFVPLTDLVALAVRQGFRVRSVGEATLDEWDTFESGYGWNMERALLATAKGSPEHRVLEELIAGHRTRWSGYRGVLGMAYLCLIAD